MNELLYILVAIFASIVYTVWYYWLLRLDGNGDIDDDFRYALMLGMFSGVFWLITLPIAVIAISSWAMVNRMTGR